MKLDKSINVDNIAKFKEDITKKRIVTLYDFLTDKSTKFFCGKSKTNISVHRGFSDYIRYDSLEEFQKNFSDSSDFKSISLSSSFEIGESIYLSVSYDKLFNGSELPVSAYISASCEKKTEVEVEDLLNEIKDFVVDLFSSSEEIMKNPDTNNTQPTDEGNEKFWIKYKPLVEFISLVLGILVVLFGFFKSCNGNAVNDEVNENQSFYSQQSEISSGTDSTALLS